MACARCSSYKPKNSPPAQLLEGKSNLLRLRQESPLNQEGIAAVDDGVAAVEKLLEPIVNVPRLPVRRRAKLRSARRTQGNERSPSGE
jgi:hypothetical protein